MARSVTLNGVVHSIPDPGDTGYASALSDYLEAIPAGVFQKSAGSFILTAEADFGSSFGIKALSFKTQTANLSATGVIRLAKTDKVSWRNNANTADLPFGINLSDGLQFNGSDIAGTGTVTSVTLTQPAAGLTLTNSGVAQTTAASSVFALANDLAALEGLSTTGFATRIGTSSWAVRQFLGVTDRTTVTFGDGVAGAPVFDISATYAGQTSITQLGTISTGTWTGTPVDIAKGGTGQVTATAAFNAIDPLTTTGDLIVHDGTNSIRVPVGTNDQFLQADSAQASGVKWASLVNANAGRLKRISATTIRLDPFLGNRIMIKTGGVWNSRLIPAAGISASNTGIFLEGVGGSTLAVNTNYYVYVFDNSGVLTIDYSTTGHSVDTDTGVEIKTGNATRTLVGFVRTDAGTEFTDSNARRWMLSWSNRQPVRGHVVDGTSRVTTSTTPVELSTTRRVEFLTWSGINVRGDAQSRAQNNTANNACDFRFGFNADSAPGSAAFASHATANGDVNLNHFGQSNALAEGSHFGTQFGSVSGGTGTFIGDFNITMIEVQG